MIQRLFEADIGHKLDAELVRRTADLVLSLSESSSSLVRETGLLTLATFLSASPASLRLADSLRVVVGNLCDDRSQVCTCQNLFEIVLD